MTAAGHTAASPAGHRARRAAVVAAAALLACQSRSETSGGRRDSASVEAPAAVDSQAAVAGADTAAAEPAETRAPNPPIGGPAPAAGGASAGRSGRESGGTAGGSSAAPAPARPAAAPQGADSVRGVVRVVGSSPLRQVVVHPTGGAAPVTLVGPDTATLRKAAGLEVVVRGARTGGELRVASFAVRSADGRPAVDGVLVRDGDALALDTAGGRVRLGNPPAALRDLVGARVWVAGPLDTGPNPFGVLKAKE